MTLDPTFPNLPPSARTLHSHLSSISSTIASLSPTLLLLSTPHGLSLHHTALLYQPHLPQPTTAEGSCEWKDGWQDWGVKVRIDSATTGHLLDHLQALRGEADAQGGGKEGGPLVRVDGLVTFAGLSTPLRWGETVPLYFALRDLTHPPSPTSPPTPPRFIDATAPHLPPLILLSQPRLGLTPTARTAFRPLLPPLLLSLGRHLRAYLDALPHRTLLLVSGDLAHTHPWPQGVDEVYLPHPASNNAFPKEGRVEGVRFDEEVKKWLTGGGGAGGGGEGEGRRWRLEEEGIVGGAGRWEEQGIACGWTGLVTMQGVMQGEDIAMKGEEERGGEGEGAVDWTLSDFCFETPTYYSMATAMFTRNEERMRRKEKP